MRKGPKSEGDSAEGDKSHGSDGIFARRFIPYPCPGAQGGTAPAAVTPLTGSRGTAALPSWPGRTPAQKHHPTPPGTPPPLAAAATGKHCAATGPRLPSPAPRTASAAVPAKTAAAAPPSSHPAGIAEPPAATGEKRVQTYACPHG
jgi:hypothetical protein